MSTSNTSSIFQHWARCFEVDSHAWSRYGGRYVITITDKPGERWLVECGTRSQVKSYSGSDIDVELFISEGDFLLLMRRELNPQHAFLDRRLHIRGKTKHVLRFNLLLEMLIEEVSSSAGQISY